MTRRLRRFLLELFSVLSRLLNVFTGGEANMSFSARSHKDDLWTEKFIDRICFLIIREEGHCKKWWETALEQNQQLAAHKKAQKNI